MKTFSSISNYKPLFIFICILFIEIILEEVLNIEVDKIFVMVYFLYFFLYSIYTLNKQEEEIFKLKKTVDEQHNEILKINNILNISSYRLDMLDSFSYRLDISIVPNWLEIKHMIAEQDIAQCESLIDEIKKDKELNIEDDKSLYGKSFDFSYFHNGISKMIQIWSKHSNAFVDEIEIQGNIYYSSVKTKFFLIDKYKNYELVDKLLLDDYIISPVRIGIEKEFYVSDIANSIIPFWKILNFLLELNKHGCYPMQKIKSFPNNLSMEMEKSGVEYDVLKTFTDSYSENEVKKEEVLIDFESDWAEINGIQVFETSVDKHIFKTKYNEIYINLKIFRSIQEY